MTRHRARVRPQSPQPVEAPDDPLVSSSEPHKRPDTGPGPAMVGKCAAHSKTRLTKGHLGVEQISESTLFSWLRWLVVDGAPKTRQQQAELAHGRMRHRRHRPPQCRWSTGTSHRIYVQALAGHPPVELACAKAHAASASRPVHRDETVMYQGGKQADAIARGLGRSLPNMQKDEHVCR